MASSSHRHHQTLPPPKRPKIELPTTTQTQTQNPEPIPDKGKSVISPSTEDTFLSNSTRLTRREVLHRRAHYMRQLTKCYKTHYWALMEDLKVQYRDYVWRFGVVPFQGQNGNLEECEGENGNNNNHNNEEGEENGGGGFGLCGFYGCKYKAMALTRFCHLHILADEKQLLYKPCTYVIKSAQAGAITCGKPILRATVPSLCNIHLPKAQAHFNRALRQAGLNITSSSKLAPKLHVLVAEYVREIQAKRKAAIREKDVVID